MSYASCSALDPSLLARIRAVALDSARVEDMIAELLSNDGVSLISFLTTLPVFVIFYVLGTCL